MRVLVTGGRRFVDAQCVAVLLDRALARHLLRLEDQLAVLRAERPLIADHAVYDPLVVVHGACGVDAGDDWGHDDVTGADGLAHRWALWRGGPVIVESHPAAWRELGRSAGMRRNAEMVATLRPGVDVVLSFPGGAGTAHATQLALTRGLRVGCPVREHRDAPWEIRWFGGPGSVVGPAYDGRAGKGRAA